jgi:hypothetical protein
MLELLRPPKCRPQRTAGKAVIAIPQTANVEAIRTSATDDRTSQRLGASTTTALAFAQRVERSLIAEHDGEKGQSLQRLDSEPQPEFADRQNRGAKDQLAQTHKNPAIVRLPIRQVLGRGEGVTLSVVNDMPRKSPVSIMMTISIGVRIACRS